jgi:cyclic pyranopterin phosphate synthase
MPEQIHIYTDGSCQGNPGPGGWAAIIRRNGQDTELAGHEDGTTNNRMEVMAAIKGLETTPEDSNVTLYSDSQYLVNTMTRGWKRRANVDLWNRLDTLVAQRNVAWEWVRGHMGHPENERADQLATGMAGTSQDGPSLTHVDEQGRVRMVDVGWKPETEREAVAKGSVVMRRQTLELIKRGEVEKGDVLSVARVAGIMGAKRTSDLIPLCHPLPLDQVTVELELDEKKNQVQITATARTTAKTGVEMEALTAVTVAALTIYDMCKAVDRGMRIESIRLVRKRGGKSGDIVLES